jgi:hypothetical protein
MQARQHRSIVARWLERLTLACTVVWGIALLLTAPAAHAGQEVLTSRLQQWPHWSLPAPLARPGRRDLTYPDWCAGDWRVQSSDGSSYAVRFLSSAAGVVGDRAFNAAAVGRAVLGERLNGVANDPGNPNRQIAYLHGLDGQPLELESTVVGRRSERPGPQLLLVDELDRSVAAAPQRPALPGALFDATEALRAADPSYVEFLASMYIEVRRGPELQKIFAGGASTFSIVDRLRELSAGTEPGDGDGEEQLWFWIAFALGLAQLSALGDAESFSATLDAFRAQFSSDPSTSTPT